MSSRSPFDSQLRFYYLLRARDARNRRRWRPMQKISENLEFPFPPSPSLILSVNKRPSPGRPQSLRRNLVLCSRRVFLFRWMDWLCLSIHACSRLIGQSRNLPWQSVTYLLNRTHARAHRAQPLGALAARFFRPKLFSPFTQPETTECFSLTLTFPRTPTISTTSHQPTPQPPQE